MNWPQNCSCFVLNWTLVNLPFLRSPWQSSIFPMAQCWANSPFVYIQVWTWTVGRRLLLGEFLGMISNPKITLHSNLAQAVVWRLNVWWAIWVSRRRCHMADFSVQEEVSSAYGLIAGAYSFWVKLPSWRLTWLAGKLPFLIGDTSSN